MQLGMKGNDMAETPASKTEPGHHAVVPLEQLSRSAYSRLYAMALEEEYAARLMLESNTYADFFTESPNVSFNEYIGPHRAPSTNVYLSRMAVVDRELGIDDPSPLARKKPNYCDIVVSFPGNGPTFHEKCKPNPKPKASGDEDAEDELTGSPQERIQMLGRSRVYAAFLRLQSGSDSST